MLSKKTTYQDINDLMKKNGSCTKVYTEKNQKKKSKTKKKNEIIINVK